MRILFHFSMYIKYNSICIYGIRVDSLCGDLYFGPATVKGCESATFRLPKYCETCFTSLTGYVNVLGPRGSRRTPQTSLSFSSLPPPPPSFVGFTLFFSFVVYDVNFKTFKYWILIEKLLVKEAWLTPFIWTIVINAFFLSLSFALSTFYTVRNVGIRTFCTRY